MGERLLLVTGASRGIGAATAERAARDGWDLVINYRSNAGAAHQVAETVRAAGRDAHVVQADIGRPEEVERLFARIEGMGVLRGLVNNAGATGGFASVRHVTAEQVADAFTVNVLGTIMCTAAAIERMAHSTGGPGGVIINVTSTSARTAGTGEWVHYAASKAASNCFTVGAAREVAADGVRIAAVAPGLVRTDLHADNGARDRPDRLGPTVPLGRVAEPAEIAAAIVWALSEQASYLVGSVIELGGGR